MRVTHRKTGHDYELLSVALDTATKRPVAVYQDADGNEVFTRPIEEFFGVEDEDGPDGRWPFRFEGAMTEINWLLDSVKPKAVTS